MASSKGRPFVLSDTADVNNEFVLLSQVRIQLKRCGGIE